MTNKTVKAFVAYNKTNKTFLTYEVSRRFTDRTDPVPKGDINLGDGMIASTNFRPKHILATKASATRWAKRANSCLSYYNLTDQGSFACVEVSITVDF